MALIILNKFNIIYIRKYFLYGYNKKETWVSLFYYLNVVFLISIK